jgi:hypothetical protein
MSREFRFYPVIWRSLDGDEWYECPLCGVLDDVSAHGREHVMEVPEREVRGDAEPLVEQGCGGSAAAPTRCEQCGRTEAMYTWVGQWVCSLCERKARQ